MKTHDFSAKPQLINRPGPNAAQFRGAAQTFKDPYREYIKIAPQNIMYDRRVVRGNTFAALVIPVNMQPDPEQAQKERMRQQAVKNRLQRMKQQQQEQAISMQMEGDFKAEMSHYSGYPKQSPSKNHDWEELEDHYNMIDESTIEPDYYIDTAPVAVFVPEEKGINHAQQLNEKNTEMFDFEQEIEPILQVLVGKSIEAARCELMLEDEQNYINGHKRTFRQRKEADLVQTQRLEGQRVRRNDEIERRNVQQRAFTTAQTIIEKKSMARNVSQQFLATFKRETLSYLTEIGLLRKPQEFSLGTSFLPNLYNQIMLDFYSADKLDKDLTEIMRDCSSRSAKNHKAAIKNEMKRRQDKYDDEERKKNEAAEAQARRRERRRCLREQLRIGQLQDKILDMTEINEKIEYTPQVKISDVRDYLTEEEFAEGQKTVYVVGGFVGELILTLNAIHSFVTSNPSFADFRFSAESMKQFLSELLVDDYPEDTVMLNLTNSLSNGQENEILDTSVAAKKLLIAGMHASFGLKFFMELANVLLINEHIMTDVYTAICMINFQKTEELQQDPEEEDPNFEALQTQRTTINEHINKRNSNLQKLQTKIKIQVREEELDYSTYKEKCLLKLNNWRDLITTQDGEVKAEPVKESLYTIQSNSNKALNKSESMYQSIDSRSTPLGMQEEMFALEKIPTKMILISQLNRSANMLVQHAEASYAIRKVIFEKAKNFWKDNLKDASVNQVLAYTQQYQKIIDTRLEEKCINELGWNLGEQYEDRNCKITYNTFLLKNDMRLLSDDQQI